MVAIAKRHYVSKIAPISSLLPGVHDYQRVAQATSVVAHNGFSALYLCDSGRIDESQMYQSSR